MAAYQSVTGIQDTGVQATIKHFIANEQEHFRGDGGTGSIISALVDDRTLHEDYLWPFSEAVRAGVGQWQWGLTSRQTPFADWCKSERYVLLQYGQWIVGTATSLYLAMINNCFRYACQNSKLLNGILKDELGFQGRIYI